MSDFVPVTKMDWLLIALFLVVAVLAITLVDIAEFAIKITRRNAWKKAGARLCFSPRKQRSIFRFKGDNMKITLAIVAISAAAILFVGCGDETKNYYSTSSSSVSTAASQSASEQSSSSAANSSIGTSSDTVSSISSSASSETAECAPAEVMIEDTGIRTEAPVSEQGIYSLFTGVYTGLSDDWTYFLADVRNQNVTVHAVSEIRVDGSPYIIERVDENGLNVYDVNGTEFWAGTNDYGTIYFGLKMRDCNSSIRFDSDRLSGVAFSPDR